MALDERAFAESLAELVKLGVDAERQRCEKIARDRAIKLRAKAKGQKSPSKQSYFARAMEAVVIADAIRAPVSEVREPRE